FLHVEGIGAVTNKLVELDEGSRIKQFIDSLTGGLFALRTLLLLGFDFGLNNGFFVTIFQVEDFPGSGVRIGDHPKGSGYWGWFLNVMWERPGLILVIHVSHAFHSTL